MLTNAYGNQMHHQNQHIFQQATAIMLDQVRKVHLSTEQNFTVDARSKETSMKFDCYYIEYNAAH